MENKYLYIDDDNHENAVEKIDGFLSENLKIDTVQHSNHSIFRLDTHVP